MSQRIEAVDTLYVRVSALMTAEAGLAFVEVGEVWAGADCALGRGATPGLGVAEDDAFTTFIRGDRRKEFNETTYSVKQHQAV